MNIKTVQPTLRLWDVTIPRPLAYTKHFNQAVDFCRDLSGQGTADGHGIAWYPLGAARFQALYGHAPVIIVNPLPYVGTVLEQRN